MKKTTKEKIIQYIEKNDHTTAAEIAEHFTIGRAMTHRHLKSLVNEEIALKTGKPPKVFYSIKKTDSPTFSKKNININEKTRKIIEDNFLLVMPNGRKEYGLNAFSIWCDKRGFDIKAKAKEYVKIFKKYNSLKKNGFINGTAKIKDSFSKICIDRVFYIDFYSLEIFGKTKLGQLLLYAKQSQDKKIISELIENIKPNIEKLIKKEKIEAVGFIPPTVKRELQFMKVLQKQLNFNLPLIDIKKIRTQVVVPQKTLNKLTDRIENADTTIIVAEKNSKYKKILLIDDAVGSGATLNQTACKIKERKVSKKVIGLSITGSAKGFDVISEV